VKDRKAKYLEVRVSESEKQAFQDAADLAGISLSTWERLRHVAVRELEAAARPIAFLSHLSET